MESKKDLTPSGFTIQPKVIKPTTTKTAQVRAFNDLRRKFATVDSQTSHEASS